MKGRCKMKIFKKLMSFALAMLTMMSAIPISSTPARAAPSNAQMMDNYVLDSMEYLGFDMDGFKASGLMYTKASLGNNFRKRLDKRE